MKIIDSVIEKEGDYSDHKNDSGGKTRWGITEKLAREFGYIGDMKTLPKDVARSIYYKSYVISPNFDKVLLLSRPIAVELIDTGINMGQKVAVRFLQIALNAFNTNQKYWTDLLIDGECGKKTLDTLGIYIKFRGLDSESVMLKTLNGLQIARYIELSQYGNKKNEDFVFGWIKNRA